MFNPPLKTISLLNLLLLAQDLPPGIELVPQEGQIAVYDSNGLYMGFIDLIQVLNQDQIHQNRLSGAYAIPYRRLALWFYGL